MKSLSVAAVLSIFLTSALGSSAAQEDLCKILVGTWEGDIPKLSKYQSKRTLIIETVREQDGKWTVEAAKYGQPGRSVRPVAVSLNPSGNDVILQFGRPGSGGHLSLKLVGEELLVGTILTHLEGYANIEFRKVK